MQNSIKGLPAKRQNRKLDLKKPFYGSFELYFTVVLCNNLVYYPLKRIKKQDKIKKLKKIVEINKTTKPISVVFMCYS